MTSGELFPGLEPAHDARYVAERQREFGSRWADALSDAAIPGMLPLFSAEIALRNPVNYAKDVPSVLLPTELDHQWQVLQDRSSIIVNATVGPHYEWAPESQPLDRLYELLKEDKTPYLTTPILGAIAGVIRDASELFARSSIEQPGNTEYYDGNIAAMESRLPAQRQGS